MSRLPRTEGRTVVARAMLACALVASGCGSASARPTASPTTAPTTTAVPWPSSCSIVEAGFGCDPEISLVAAPDRAVEIAKVVRSDLVRVTWSELPDRRARPFARVDAVSDGVHFRGWASLEGHLFALAKRVDVLAPNLWMPAGARVSIRGMREDRIVVAARTGFDNPSEIEGDADCTSLGTARESEQAPVGPPYAAPSGEHIAIHSDAAGPVVLEAKPSANALFVWLGESNGRVHVRGGPPPYAPVLGGEPFVFDGWVESSEVRRLDALPGVPDRDDGGCDVLDARDTCPTSSYAPGTSVWVGATPAGDPIGELERGAAVERGDRHGDYVVIRLVNDGIRPPAGQSFWIRAADVHPEACGGGGDDGCPSCP